MFPFSRIGQGIIKHAPCPAYGHRRNGNSCCVEPGIHHLEPAIDLAQYLCIRQAAVIKFQYHVLIAAMADTFVPIADGEARMSTINKKAADPLLRTLGRHILTRSHKDDQEIGVIRARDEMFGAV